MSFINLAQIEKTIKASKNAEKMNVKMEAKREEQNKFSIKKLPTHSGNFNFKSPPSNYRPPPPPYRPCEYREGLLMASKDLIVDHCKKYGCDSHILKKELDESRDIKYFSDTYISMFDDMPDFFKCGLTVMSKIGISKAGLNR